MGVPTLFPVIFLLTTCLLTLSYGHAVLELPRSRNFLATSITNMDGRWDQVEYCPHCLNLGGVALVSNNRASVWPSGNKGGPAVCGEAFNAGNPQYQLNTAGTDARRYNRIWAKRLWGGTYRSGQRFLVKTRFYTYHRGMIQLQLCVMPNWSPEREASMLTNECFQRNIVRQSRTNSAQPGSDWWYLPNNGLGANGATPGYAQEGWQGDLKTNFTLPQGITCDFDNSRTKCVLRMYYLTGNTCKRPNVPAQYQNTVSQILQTCGAPGAPYPEEFYNCADLYIRPPRTATAGIANASLAGPSIFGVKTPIKVEQAPPPPGGPLDKCKDGSTLECFCKGQVLAGKELDAVGFQPNPFDATKASYLGCDLAGRVIQYKCPTGTKFEVGKGCN